MTYSSGVAATSHRTDDRLRGSGDRGTTALAPPIHIALLSGCQDRPYAFGLAVALCAAGVRIDIIGGDETDSPEFHTNPALHFLNWGGHQHPRDSRARKLLRWAKYYGRLLRYAAAAEPAILHVLWNNKCEYFDRTLLMLYYKLNRKRVVLTAHNVNQGRRDSNDSLLNRLTLRVQYRLADHIFVHTQKMKAELLREFGVREGTVTVLRHPINDAFPDTDLSPAEAKRRLGLKEHEKAILFFGRIRPYKGLEDLLTAFRRLADMEPDFRLIIAGEPKKGSEAYLKEIQRTIRHDFTPGKIIAKMKFIPDAETEVYLKAADVLVLPYKEIFQSGVLFLAYSYGLPVVATDVGSFREEIVEGRTGFLCEPGNSFALGEAIRSYFASDLYAGLKIRRQEIKAYAHAQHSWKAVADLTRNAYAGLVTTQSP